MTLRWIVVDDGEIKEYPTAKIICKKYNTSHVSLYNRLKVKNNSPGSKFGTKIKIYRIPGEFGDPIDEKLLTNE